MSASTPLSTKRARDEITDLYESNKKIKAKSSSSTERARDKVTSLTKKIKTKSPSSISNINGKRDRDETAGLYEFSVARFIIVKCLTRLYYEIVDLRDLEKTMNAFQGRCKGDIKKPVVHLRKYNAHIDWISIVDWSCDGRKIASGECDKTIKTIS
nr:1545_t:CDS:2 [Entrophospora candida]